MDNRDRDHLRVIIQLAIGRVSRLFRPAFAERSGRMYEAQREIAEATAAEVLAHFDVSRKDDVILPGAGAQYRGPSGK